VRFSVTYRDASAARQTGPSADVSAGNEYTEEIAARDAAEAARMIQVQPGREPGGIDILSVQPIDDGDQHSMQS